jgi:transposase
VDTFRSGIFGSQKGDQVPRSRPPYPPEFRSEAVRLAKSADESIAQIASDLGISDQTLRNWVAQDDVDAGKRPGLSSDERAELRVLRKQNRKLREEREILKKAAVFFAGETERR